MSRGRRGYRDRARRRVLDLWEPRDGAGRPIGCVATTYTFDAGHFEEHCLARFLGLQCDPVEMPTGYLIEREERLAESSAWILVDRSHVDAERSLRWNLLPVAVPGGGILHAKLSLLVWEHSVRVLIGSANLTKPGYRANQEVVAALDFGGKDGADPRLLREAIEFLERIRTFAPGHGRTDLGPQASLGRYLARVRQWADALLAVEPAPVGCHLVPLLPGPSRSTVLDQLGTIWQGARAGGARRPAPTDAWVVSPFYNEGADAKRVADKLAEQMAERGPKSITFIAPGRIAGDDTIEIQAPEALQSPKRTNVTHAFGWVDELQRDGASLERRPLHAKSITLGRDNRELYLIGSSNFTVAGLGLKPECNVELNLVYDIRDNTTEFARLCDESLPEWESIADPAKARFEATPNHSDGDVLAPPALPDGFGLALFRSDGSRTFLELEITEASPRVFKVSTFDGRSLLDSAAWRAGGARSPAVCDWTEARPPSALAVTWIADDGSNQRAEWVINIGEAADLPPPDALKALTLDELLEVLSSSRPLHDAIARILELRNAREQAAENGADAALRRVDTSTFILQRMRRISRALEGLRDRLSQPVFSADALEWRLRGPVGPLVLAGQIAASEGEAAGFMLAELAQTLVDIRPAAVGGVAPEQVRARLFDVVAEIRALARSAPAPASLRAHVEQTFAECLS